MIADNEESDPAREPDGDALAYARLHEILIGASRSPDDELDVYLARECGDDRDLRNQVVALLQSARDERANDIFAEHNVATSRVAFDQVVDQATATWLPEQIGDYRIVKQIGHGGMGVIYEAEQPSLKRRVAIKLLHPIHATGGHLRRFRHEAELLGRFQHRGIAQIYEAGHYDIGRGPQPFFAMELVKGVDICTHCDQHDLNRRARIELILAVANAVEYAHSNGVVHRDLKPDNVLIDERGQPRVLDFGIARTTDQVTALSTMLTEQGQLIGTLGYMAPEQLSGATNAVTPLVDVYALGVLTFELLTHTLPRHVGDLPVSKAIAILAEADAPPAGKVDPSLKGDLETILGKALESDVSRRYQTVAAFANDLRRHLADEPIQARPPSRVYLVRKFARRHRGLVVGGVATLLTAITGAAVATSYAFEATRRAAELERRAYIASVAAANHSVLMQDYREAATHLERTPEAHRGWEYRYLQASMQHHAAEWQAPAACVGQPVIDGQGQRMFVLLADGTIGCWACETGALLRVVALADTIGTDTPYWNESIVLHGPTLRFAATSRSGKLAIGDLMTGECSIYDAPDAVPYAWNESGSKLLVGIADKVCIWNGTDHQVLAEDARGRGCFSPRGDRVALAHSQSVVLYDATTGERLAETILNDSAQHLSFSPDGSQVVVACYYNSAYLLDGASLAITARLSGHLKGVWGTAWTADGRAMTSSQDGSVRIWERTGRLTDVRIARVEVNQWDGSGVPTTRCRVARLPGGRRAVVVGDRIVVIAVDDPTVLRGHDTFVYQITFSSDGSMLASSCFRRCDIRVWDVHAGKLLHRVNEHGTPLKSGYPLMAFSADNRRLIAQLPHGPKHWDVANGKQLDPTPPDPQQPNGIPALLGEARAMAQQGDRAQVSRDGQWAVRPSGTGAVVYARLASAGDGSRASWDSADPSQYAPASGPLLIGHEGAVYCAAMHPDGTRIATGGNDATIRIWDTETREQLLVLHGHESYVHDLEFSPDGTMLASASGDATVRLWDTLSLSERRAKQRR